MRYARNLALERVACTQERARHASTECFLIVKKFYLGARDGLVGITFETIRQLMARHNPFFRDATRRRQWKIVRRWAIQMNVSHRHRGWMDTVRMRVGIETSKEFVKDGSSWTPLCRTQRRRGSTDDKRKRVYNFLRPRRMHVRDSGTERCDQQALQEALGRFCHRNENEESLVVSVAIHSR